MTKSSGYGGVQYKRKTVLKVISTLGEILGLKEKTR
jgi:hypothetical protein